MWVFRTPRFNALALFYPDVVLHGGQRDPGQQMGVRLAVFGGTDQLRLLIGSGIAADRRASKDRHSGVKSTLTDEDKHVEHPRRGISIGGP